MKYTVITLGIVLFFSISSFAQERDSNYYKISFINKIASQNIVIFGGVGRGQYNKLTGDAEDNNLSFSRRRRVKGLELGFEKNITEQWVARIKYDFRFNKEGRLHELTPGIAFRNGKRRKYHDVYIDIGYGRLKTQSTVDEGKPKYKANELRMDGGYIFGFRYTKHIDFALDVGWGQGLFLMGHYVKGENDMKIKLDGGDEKRYKADGINFMILCKYRF